MSYTREEGAAAFAALGEELPATISHHNEVLKTQPFHTLRSEGSCSCKNNPGVAAVLTASRAPVCPECRSGKHRNCDGTALDEAADDIVECRCPPAFHPEKNRS